MTSISEYREIVRELNALDVSLNLFERCTIDKQKFGILELDSNNDFYVINQNGISLSFTPEGSTVAGTCPTPTGLVGYEELQTQVTNGINRLKSMITGNNNDKLNSSIVNSKFNETNGTLTALKDRYNNLLKKRRNLDLKMQELYMNTGGFNDIQMQTDSAIYGALLWTVLATSLIYYIFVKL